MSILQALWGSLSAGRQDAYKDRRTRERKAADDIIGKARGEHQAIRGVIPNVDRLGNFKYLLTNAEGLSFHDGKAEVIINAYWARLDVTKERGAMLGSWSEREGIIALVDTTGRMYLGPAQYVGNDGKTYSLGAVLEQHNFFKSNWQVPVGSGDMPIGRIDYSSLTRVKPNIGLHRHIQTKLQRDAFGLPGQLERFVKGAERPPATRAIPPTISH